MKKSFTYILLVLFLVLSASCSSDDHDENLEDLITSPEVAILNPAQLENIHTDSVLHLKARLLNNTVATFSWLVNGKEVSQDSILDFSSSEKGEYKIVLKASNINGESTDELNIQVLDGFYLSNILNWTGEGENESALVIQWVTGSDIMHPKDDEVFSLAWGYRWQAKDAPTGMDLIKAIAKHDKRLYVILAEQWGGFTVKGFGYDGNNDGKIEISNGSIHLTQADFGDDGIYMVNTEDDVDGFVLSDKSDYWIGGWQFFYATYWLGEGDAVLSEDGYSYSNFIPSQRELENKSWDAWTFSAINQETMENLYPIPRLINAAPVN